jgi:N-acetyl-anhydromuramyl-L-alanine amidase AmpD
MFDQILNPNNTYTNRNADNIYRSNIGVKQGVVVNVSRENHLAQTYDVQDLETGALFLGCKYQSPTGGFNGVGRYAPLDEGTLVTYTCAEGIGENGIITGTLYTEGNYNKYYSEGKLQEFAQLEEYSNQLFEINQPSGHPNRITDPGATATFYGANNLFNTFSDARFTNNIKDKAKANRQPGIIDLATSIGDKVNYAYNSIINYTANIINVAEGTAESKCAKLIEYANYYNRQADLLAQTSIIRETTPEEAKKTTGIKPIVSKQSNPKSQSNLRSPFTDQYFIDQYKKLAQMYLEQAQSCNRGDTARQLVGLQMQTSSGSELPQGEQSVEGQQTKPDYKPNEEKSSVAATNYGERTQTKFKPLIVLHETIGNANSVINLFQNPKAQVSYHVMIKLDGGLVYFTDPKKRAFGAAPSQFKEEFEERVRDDGKKVKSVNSFAYHISFETPVDGQPPNDNKSTHSGYTEAQYNSLAWLTAKTGVPLERITTHKEVNITQPNISPNIDPRSFDRVKFEKLWNNYPKTKEIFFGIGDE